jgi:hypothetical protein
MTPRKQDLKALRNLISEAHGILATTTLPEGRSERACELLSAAVRLADDLLSVSPAAVLGAKGGKKTAKRGPEYYAQIAAMRTTHGGGRPKKTQ